MTTKYLNTTKSLRLEHGLIDTFYSYATPVAFRSMTENFTLAKTFGPERLANT
jgi:hypothetical protein